MPSKVVPYPDFYKVFTQKNTELKGGLEIPLEHDYTDIT